MKNTSNNHEIENLYFDDDLPEPMSKTMEVILTIATLALIALFVGAVVLVTQYFSSMEHIEQVAEIMSSM